MRVSPDLEMSVIHPGGKKQTPIAAFPGGPLISVTLPYV